MSTATKPDYLMELCVNGFQVMIDLRSIDELNKVLELMYVDECSNSKNQMVVVKYEEFEDQIAEALEEKHNYESAQKLNQKLFNSIACANCFNVLKNSKSTGMSMENISLVVQN